MDERLLDRFEPQLAGWADPLARLRDALEKDEFALFCQPILALQEGERYPMAEILVRLREEEQALLPPGDFLPVFEHYRMMPQLDRWVVRHVVERLARGSRIARLTVNVSGQTLEDAEFPGFIAAELTAKGVAASSLMFEIDESDLQHRLLAAARFAAAVKAIGVGLLIDGFCRRTVSFAPLKTLQVDLIKVDGSVIRKLLSSSVAMTKMNALVRVAEAIGVRLVAECVEDREVLARLKSLGVGYAQGFGVYQPHPLDSIAAPASR
ncbi:MAG: EAL domain-containing protein, partial [Pseudomonadota bacterium]|nr:EAL domain-containing protein [Pseudomonadota bacterium]